MVALTTVVKAGGNFGYPSAGLAKIFLVFFMMTELPDKVKLIAKLEGFY
jgi:hypothetical protein